MSKSLILMVNIQYMHVIDFLFLYPRDEGLNYKHYFWLMCSCYQPIRNFCPLSDQSIKKSWVFRQASFTAPHHILPAALLLVNLPLVPTVLSATQANFDCPFYTVAILSVNKTALLFFCIILFQQVVTVTLQTFMSESLRFQNINQTFDLLAFYCRQS